MQAPLEKPIWRLFSEIGREPTDRVIISSYNDVTEWKSHPPIQAQHADMLAEGLTSQGLNVYISVNPVDPEAVIRGRGDVTSVTALAALWADLDIKPGGMPSVEAARRVIDNLSSVINSNPVAIVHSGHGLQPYWAIEDGGVSDLNRNFISGVLKRWGYMVKRFAEIEGGKVDSVFDLPRVLRAPGSINVKDPKRPIPVTVEWNEWSHPVSINEVVEAVEAYGFLNENITVDEFVVVSPPSEWEPAPIDCAWAKRLAKEIDTADPKERHPWLLGQATIIEVAARNGCITNDTYLALARLLEAKFLDLLANTNPPRKAAPGEVSTAFKWARMRVATFSDAKMAENLDYHKHRGETAAADLPKESTPSDKSSTPAPSASEAIDAPEVQEVALGDENYFHTDAANAERLAQAAQGQYIFVPGLGWYTWQKGHYVKDEKNSIVRLAIQTLRDYAESSPTKASIAWAQKSMSAGGIASSVRLCESVPNMVVLPHSLDSQALLLCTPGGIVNLETGRLAPARLGVDLHTRQTRFTPQSGPAPRWEAFLRMVLEDDDRIEYMQELFGVALIGEVRYQILPILSGAGANGKSTLLEIAGGCLGDYSAVMPENFLLESAKLEHSTEIFRLRGVRLAIAAETRPDGKFNESRVKMLTGEQTLSARGMRQDFVDFPATHTIFVALNHPPQVKAGGDGFWRRIRKIDFRYQVPKHLRDPNLVNKILDEEGPQVLQWMIEGAQRVLQNGLSEPTSVELSTGIYRDEEDHIGAFMHDMCDVNPDAEFSNMELYSTYVAWCRRNGEMPLSSVALMRDLRARYPLVPVRNKRARGWKGIYVHYEREDDPVPRMSAGFPQRVRPVLDGDGDTLI